MASGEGPGGDKTPGLRDLEGLNGKGSVSDFETHLYLVLAKTIKPNIATFVLPSFCYAVLTIHLCVLIHCPSTSFKGLPSLLSRPQTSESRGTSQVRLVDNGHCLYIRRHKFSPSTCNMLLS